MALSKEFKALPISKQRAIVGRTKSMHEAGFSAEDIASKLGLSIELVKESIEMIEKAKRFKEENGL